MKELFSSLEKLFKAFGEVAHLPKWLINEITFYILLFGFLLTLLNLLWKLIKFVLLTRNQRILNRDLHPYFSNSDVERATRYYIPTKYQNVAPSEDDEPGRYYIASPKDQLIPLFLKKAFKFGEDDHKFYLILADAGMGKTTLMVNLYLAYKNQWKLPWHLKKHDIKLLPLGAPNILEKVKSIEEKGDTILLLDAFDEDIEALHDHDKRMKEILEVAKDFRKIVITSRTQFFPSKKEEPHETGYITYGDENKEIKFQKLYLSVFDDKDIKKYLRKRFSPFSRLQKKYYKAYKIIKKSPNLMVRPMLLSHIEDLVNSKPDFEFSYQIYEVLINKWIEREASKPGIKEKYGSKERYQELLYEFSHQLAIDLYENKENRGGYFIAKKEEFGKDTSLSLTDFEEDHLQLSEAEMRSKSLLNRNAIGQYKFSHKSVLEYFLAKEAVENVEFFMKFNFKGNDAAKNFISEMVFDNLLLPNLIKCSGSFSTRNTKSKPLNQLSKNDFGKIKTFTIKKIPDNLDIVYLSSLETLEELLIIDKDKYKLLYLLYSLFIRFWVLLDKLDNLDQLNLQGLLNQLKLRGLLDQLKLRGLLDQEFLDQQTLRHLRTLRVVRDQPHHRRLLKFLKRQGLEDKLDLIEQLELIDQIELIDQLSQQKSLVKLSQQDLIDLIDQRDQSENLIYINSYLRKIKWIENRLPHCKIFY